MQLHNSLVPAPGGGAALFAVPNWASSWEEQPDIIRKIK
jgi:hypothetical protein